MNMTVMRLMCAVLTTIALALMTVPAVAQGGGPISGAAASAGVDFSNVQIETTKYTDNFYVLLGDSGTRARFAVLTGPDGILLVDAYFRGMSEKTLAAIRQISDAPIRYLINTHGHPDHVGGDAFLKDKNPGLTIMARPELRARALTPGSVFYNVDPAGLPTMTYEGPMTIYMNGEAVRLIPMPPAHTDGDTLVYFPVTDVMMPGDVIRTSGYPNFGGGLEGILEAHSIMIGLCGPNTKVIVAHGPVTDRAGLIKHRDMILTVRDRVAKLIKEGKTLDQVIAAHPTADFDAMLAPSVPTYYDVSLAHDRTYMIPDPFLRQMYAELTKEPADFLKTPVSRNAPRGQR